MLRPHDEQRQYLLEQLTHACGEEWVRANGHRVESWWETIVELGYALPDEPIDKEEPA